jgi:cell division septation protein DedD
MSRRTRRAVLVLLALAVSVLPAFAAREKASRGDTFAEAPDVAAYGVKSIAMLPVVSYDKNARAEQTVMALLGLKLKDTGYRWVSASTAKAMIRSTLGDSMLKVVADEVLAKGQLDSLRAPLLSARLRTDALLCVRVEQWEQQQILWNQSGKPNTTVRVRAALVDSTGALLWSAASSETGEGPHNDPSTNPMGMKATALEPTPLTGQLGPPAFDAVLDRILVRWQPRFPRPPAAAPAAPVAP